MFPDINIIVQKQAVCLLMGDMTVTHLGHFCRLPQRKKRALNAVYRIPNKLLHS